MAEEVKKEETKKEITLTLTEGEAETLFYALTTAIAVLGIRAATPISEEEYNISNRRMDNIMKVQLKLSEGQKENDNQQ